VKLYRIRARALDLCSLLLRCGRANLPEIAVDTAASDDGACGLYGRVEQAAMIHLLCARE
jgi:hypothetical protein